MSAMPNACGQDSLGIQILIRSVAVDFPGGVHVLQAFLFCFFIIVLAFMLMKQNVEEQPHLCFMLCLACSPSGNRIKAQ